MKLYRDATTTQRGELAPQEPGPAALLWDALKFTFGASVAVVVAGGVLLPTIRGQADWTGIEWFFRLAALPWAVTAVVAMAAGIRLTWGVWEHITGRDLDNSGAIGDPFTDRVRLVPVRGGRLVDGVDERDLVRFVEVIHATKRWGQRDWRGVDMPSGIKADNDYWGLLCAPLRRVGILTGVTQGGKGTLTTKSADEALALLGLNGSERN